MCMIDDDSPATVYSMAIRKAKKDHKCEECQRVKTEVISPEKIKELRKKAGHTQAKAAAIARCSLRAWQDWEYGKNPMPIGVLELYYIKAFADIDRALHDLSKIITENQVKP